MSRLGTIHTAMIGGQLWSFGYRWHLANSLETIRRDALTEAALPSVLADVYALRSDSSHPQYGLGKLECNDRKRGMIAANAFANFLTAQTVRSGLGLFRFGNVWWLAVLTYDQIPTDGDQVFGDGDEALSAWIREFSKRSDWSRLFLPGDIIERSKRLYREAAETGAELTSFDKALHDYAKVLSSAPLDEILGDIKTGMHVRRTVRRNDVIFYLTTPVAKMTASLAVIAVLAIFALPSMIRKIHRLLDPPPVSKPQAAVASVAPTELRVQIREIPPASQSAPLPSAIAAACLAALDKIFDHVPAGWETATFQCDGTAASTALSRATGGTLADLELAFPDAQLSWEPSFTKGLLVIALQLAPSHSRAITLERPDQMRRRLTTLGWQVNESVTIDLFAAPVITTPNVVARWQSANFNIEAITDPLEWSKVLDAIPGITISSISLDPKDLAPTSGHHVWQIKGVSYAQ